MNIKKGIFYSLLITFVIYIIVYFLLLSLFVGLNYSFFSYFKKILPYQKVNSDIIVVEIDDLSYNKLGFPIDRSDYVPFLNNLSGARPAVIGFDILFADKGKDPRKDLALSKKFKQLSNIVIGFDIDSHNNFISPYELFRDSVVGMGYFKPTVDEFTNYVYSLKPTIKMNNKGTKGVYESFSFSVLRQYFNYIYNKNEKNISLATNGEYNFFDRLIPVRGGEFYINYNEVSDFHRESFYNIYTGNFNKEKFKDKIVLVGYTAEGVKDDFLLPGISNGALTKGVYVHANAINNILNDNYIIYFNQKIEILISIIFIFFIVLINIFYLKNQTLKWISVGAISLFLLITFFYVIIFILVFNKSGVYLVPNYPFNFLLVLFLSFFMSSIVKYKNEDKNKRLLSQALSEYVSSDIAREILYSSGEVKLSGENKKITIFFSDIAGFTTISEKMSPEDLVAFLRIYLGEMSNIILDNKGFINKYEGDAIMALWGVFGKVDNFGVINACNSCLLQQSRLSSLNNIWREQGKNELQVRMGLHVGPAIIGNIGATGRKMEFTALGDSVNLGSRLEGVNKFYGTNICVSQDVYDIAKEDFTFRYLDKIKVKGKNIGINIFELVSRIGEESSLKKEIIEKFLKGIEYYLNRDFNKAIEVFSELGALGDAPSLVYVSRCESYIKNPPGNDWDGIWVMEEK